MHGIILLELKKYVDVRVGTVVWPQLLRAAGLDDRMYLPVQEYPDADVVALVGAASQSMGKSPDVILEDFGEFIVPDLVQVYRSLIHSSWKTLDLIEHTEKMIHRVVRMRNPGARPPELIVERTSPTALSITYRSARKMCGIAKGIVRGVAKHYGEAISIEEPSCMHLGAPECIIQIKLQS